MEHHALWPGCDAGDHALKQGGGKLIGEGSSQCVQQGFGALELFTKICLALFPFQLLAQVFQFFLELVILGDKKVRVHTLLGPKLGQGVALTEERRYGLL